MTNIFHKLPLDPCDEQFSDLLVRPGVRIERIVSMGNATPPGEWLEQYWDEWVLVLTGAAGVLLEGEPVCRLQRGESLLIPAGKRHRVEWTDGNQATLWLAVHIGE